MVTHMVTRTKGRSLHVRITPAIYERLSEIADAYREAGITMSPNRLGELYVHAGLLRDGYGADDPVGAACAAEATAALTHSLEPCPHNALVRRIQTRRGELMRAAARHYPLVMRDPETVAAERAVIESEA